MLMPTINTEQLEPRLLKFTVTTTKFLKILDHAYSCYFNRMSLYYHSRITIYRSTIYRQRNELETNRQRNQSNFFKYVNVLFNIFSIEHLPCPRCDKLDENVLCQEILSVDLQQLCLIDT